MELMLTRTLSGLAAADQIAVERLRKWPIGETVRCDVKKPRNHKNLRRWWALCGLIYENSEVYASPQIAHQHLKILCGHAIPIASKSTGEIYLVPDSISYDRLEENEFQEVWKRAKDAVRQHILPGVTSEDLELEIMQIIGDARTS